MLPVGLDLPVFCGGLLDPAISAPVLRWILTQTGTFCVPPTIAFLAKPALATGILGPLDGLVGAGMGWVVF